VDRNRLKRRLRELARVEIVPETWNVDVVLYARREAYEASFALLSADVQHAATQIHRSLSRAN
jgi:ribonuclease P protein component